MAATTQIRLLGNIMDKIDSLSVSFDISADSELSSSLNDATREMKISDLNSVEQDTDTELYLELRSVWWFLFRCRNSSSVNFKYSTGSLDGKAVDKTKVTEEIDKIMKNIDQQFTQWKSTAANVASSGSSLWNRTKRESSTLR